MFKTEKRINIVISQRRGVTQNEAAGPLNKSFFSAALHQKTILLKDLFSEKREHGERGTGVKIARLR